MPHHIVAKAYICIVRIAALARLIVVCAFPVSFKFRPNHLPCFKFTMVPWTAWFIATDFIMGKRW